MILPSDFEKGTIINIDGQPCQIIDISFMKPGKGEAVYRTKLKNLKTGSNVNKTFRSGERLEELEKESKDATYLYSDRKNSVFLIKDQNQRISLPLETTQEQIKYIIPNSQIRLLYINEELISIEIPIKVALKVTEAAQAARGNTATNVLKKVKVETGIEIEVPMFIETGDTIIVNTDTGEYVQRA